MIFENIVYRFVFQDYNFFPQWHETFISRLILFLGVDYDESLQNFFSNLTRERFEADKLFHKSSN